MNEEGKSGCGPLFLKVVLMWAIFVLGLFVGLAKGAANDAEQNEPVAEQVIRALVEAAEGNEIPVDHLVLDDKSTNNITNNSTTQDGIVNLAGIDPEMVLAVDKPRWTAEEAQMLVTLAMAEAEGEDIVGKALVIMVVLNRVESNSFPDSIEEVIFQKDQFSPVKPGHRYYKVIPSEECWAALEMVEHGWDESQGALYFERNTERSTWHSRNLIELFSHGKHTFYKEG